MQVEAIDLDLMEWTAACTPRLQAVTLETEMPGELGLQGQINLIKGIGFSEEEARVEI